MSRRAQRRRLGANNAGGCGLSWITSCTRRHITLCKLIFLVLVCTYLALLYRIFLRVETEQTEGRLLLHPPPSSSSFSDSKSEGSPIIDVRDSASKIARAARSETSRKIKTAPPPSPSHSPPKHPERSTSPQSREKPPSSPFAYAFVIGGIHERRPSYRGFLYGVLVAVRALRREGSTADFVLWAQLSPDSALPAGALPDGDARLLEAHGVRVRFAAPHAAGGESFAQVVFEKFRTLGMVEYKRVMFLDADVMPLNSLDYLFHLSMPAAAGSGEGAVLRPNLILATLAEPCNTAVFMVAPSAANWETLQGIVLRQREEGLKLPYPHFDRGRGWGHRFYDQKKKNETDKWEAVAENDTAWRFHASISDQGLMFYYAKYAIMDTSIVIGKRLQNWVPGADGKPKKVFEGAFEEIPRVRASVNTTLHEIHHQEHRRVFDKKELLPNKNTFKWINVPYRDFLHFSGRDKPWQTGITGENKKIWFRELGKMNKEHNMGLDIDHWKESHTPLTEESPLGYMAKFWDHALTVQDGNTNKKKDVATGVGTKADVGK